MRVATVLLTICTAAFCCGAARAETIFLGPTPYLSAADSPFDLSGLGTTFFLEDFEQSPRSPPFTTPGIEETGFAVVWGGGLSQFVQADSVDADDGLIDGDGSAGHSLHGVLRLIGGSTGTHAITLEFDSLALGGLPSEFGFVLTDTGTGGFFTFEAFDRSEALVGRVSGPFVGDGEVIGATAEDRFFGVTHADGIGSLIIALNGPLDEFLQLEIDHVQYGQIVPEPSGWFLFAAGIVVLLPRVFFR